MRARLPGGSGDECGDYVGSVPVERGPATVISDRGARVSVGGGILHVAQRHASIQRGSNEGMPECVRADDLSDPSAAGDAAHDSGGAVAVQPPAVWDHKDGAFAPFADGQV